MHFFAVTARLRTVKMPNFFTFCGGREHTVLFLNFDTVYTVFQKSTPDKKLPTFDALKGIE